MLHPITVIHAYSRSYYSHCCITMTTYLRNWNLFRLSLPRARTLWLELHRRHARWKVIPECVGPRTGWKSASHLQVTSKFCWLEKSINLSSQNCAYTVANSVKLLKANSSYVYMYCVIHYCHLEVGALFTEIQNSVRCRKLLHNREQLPEMANT